MPLLGVFATRTNLRPNPIGLTLCELVLTKPKSCVKVTGFTYQAI
jgi:tRNA (Thr-GGU) A37 N-methylase